MTLKKVLEIERRSTRSHYMENLLWKRLWTCLNIDCTMMMIMMMMMMMMMINGDE